jgi:hypothetical protein
MSHQKIHASALTRIAGAARKARLDTLVAKYYSSILAAAQDGKFEITFIMESDAVGKVLCDEWTAMEKIGGLFPGINPSFDAEKCSYTFDWYRSSRR